LFAGRVLERIRLLARKGYVEMPRRKPRPVAARALQKGCSKPKGGNPLDERLAAHAGGRAAFSVQNRTGDAAFSSRSLSPAGSIEVSFAPGAIVCHALAPHMRLRPWTARD
jgi:hypothetical protein